MDATERLSETAYLDTLGLRGVLNGPASTEPLFVRSTQPYHLAVSQVGDDRLRFVLVSRAGRVVAEREVEVEMGDDGHAYTSAVGVTGIPFLLGLVVHGQVRLSCDHTGALAIEHAQSTSGALLLLGYLLVDRERTTFGRFRRVSFKAIQVVKPRRSASDRLE